MKKSITFLCITVIMVGLFQSCSSFISDAKSDIKATAKYVKSGKQAVEDRNFVNLDYLLVKKFNNSTEEVHCSAAFSYLNGKHYAVYTHFGENNVIKRAFRITPKYIDMVDFENQEITRLYRKGETENAYAIMKTWINDNYAEYYAYYYSIGLPSSIKPQTIPVSEARDTTINGTAKMEFLSIYPVSHLFNQKTGEYDTPLQYEAHTWVDATTHQLDSVIAFTIQGPFDERLSFAINNVGFDDKTYYYDSIFCFENPIYKGFTKSDDQLPPSMRGSSAEELNENNLSFPIISLSTGDTTSLANEEGWLLLDMWRFGCPGCDLGFRNLANEKDSLGYRIMEHEGVKILSVNTNSNNTELLSEYAEAFRCADIIYHGKGLQTELCVNAFPTYYLISPDKQIIWRGNELGNYSELLKAKEEYDKTQKTD